jgi:MFS family permease
MSAEAKDGAITEKENTMHLGYATALICGASFFSYLDRAGLSILVEPIKADLELSDAQIGLLTGLAFSLTYALFGIPLARLTDTGNRARLLAACLAVWSIATAMAAAATNFLQLILTRVIVGIGEAGGFPASNSLIGDLYTPEQRTRGMSWMQMSIAAGSWLGLIAVGFVADAFGWRIAFIAMGAPGILLAWVIWLTMKEPERGRFASNDSSAQPPADWVASIRAVFARKTVQHLLFGFAVVSFCGSGTNAWLGAFFMRSHDLDVAGVGLLLGTAGGIGAMAGAALGVLAWSQVDQARSSLGDLVTGRWFRGASADLSLHVVGLEHRDCNVLAWISRADFQFDQWFCVVEPAKRIARSDPWYGGCYADACGQLDRWWSGALVGGNLKRLFGAGLRR